MSERIVSHYRVLEKLGEGGMGVVYAAEDLNLRRRIALKFLPTLVAADDRRRQRFIREAMTASSLDHPNICTIHEIGTAEDGQLFIAMALYEGSTLKQRLKHGCVPVPEALEICTQAGVGLSKAHASGVIHRDIKPANLIITGDGLVKIVDFGLARTRSEAEITRTGELIGTLAYMSPEQIDGEGVDARSDIWSLGVVAYEALTGVRPFRGNAATLVLSVRDDLQQPAHLVRPEVPEGVSRAVDRALAKDPRRRFETMDEFIEALHAGAQGGVIDVTETVTRTGAAETLVRDAAGASGTGRVSGVRARLPSVAVMPFDTIGGGEDAAFLGVGIADELIHALAAHDGLRVVSRSSVHELRSQQRTLSEIARLLRVDAVLEGSVHRSGTRVRILARLVEPRDDSQIWADRYDREVADVFALQDEIARSIAERLEVALVSTSSSLRKPNYRGSVEAYELYLKGRYFWNRRLMDRALASFQKSLEVDPDFAPAHAGLANYYSSLGAYGAMAPSVVWPLVRASALRALELDRNLAEAHIALAYLRTFEEWDWDGAAHAIQRALELTPGLVDPHLTYSMHLFQTGRFEAAFDEIDRAKDLDPLSSLVAAFEIGGHLYAGHYDRAITLGDRALELAPESLDIRMFRALALQEAGRLDDALGALETLHEETGGAPLLAGFLGTCRAARGEEAEARELLAALRNAPEGVYVPPVSRAFIHARLGEIDEAFAVLDDATKVRDALLCYVRVMPGFGPLRGDARLEGLLGRMGLAGRPG